MNALQSATTTLHELGEIRGLIQQRSGIVFDESRARFFSHRLREHMEHKGLERGADLLRLMESHFDRSGSDYVVRRKLREFITFAPMNLAHLIYMGRFDCIFCMNVLIYFSEELRTALIQRFSDYLQPGGYLFLGHAESMAKA